MDGAVSTRYAGITFSALTTTMKNLYFLCDKSIYKLKHIRTISAQNGPTSDSTKRKYNDDAILDKSVIFTHHLKTFQSILEKNQDPRKNKHTTVAKKNNQHNSRFLRF